MWCPVCSLGIPDRLVSLPGSVFRFMCIIFETGFRCMLFVCGKPRIPVRLYFCRAHMDLKRRCLLAVGLMVMINRRSLHWMFSRFRFRYQISSLRTEGLSSVLCFEIH